MRTYKIFIKIYFMMNIKLLIWSNLQSCSQLSVSLHTSIR